MPDDICRNPWRKAKHQQELLKDYFNHHRASAGQDRSEMEATLGTEEADVSPFQNYSIIPITFI